MKLSETSKSIDIWAEAAFGPVGDLNDLIQRAAEELDEIRQAVRNREPADAIVMETADVAILLHRIAAVSGFDLAEAVDRKMRINRGRHWRRSGDGTGRHLAQEPDDAF